MAPRSSEDTILQLQAPKVWLSQETRDDLERFSRSRTLPASLVQRVQIILRAAVGQDTQQIAAALNLCRQTVGRWRERYMAEGQRGLEDRYRSGCHAQITAILAGEWNRSLIGHLSRAKELSYYFPTSAVVSPRFFNRISWSRP